MTHSGSLCRPKRPLVGAALMAAALLLAACGEQEKDAPLGDNDTPVAQLQLPARIEAGRPVLMDASASSDPDGFIEEFLFDPGDGSPLLQTSGDALFHTFTEPGERLVTLTVIDDQGTKDTDRVEVLVIAP